MSYLARNHCQTHVFTCIVLRILFPRNALIEYFTSQSVLFCPYNHRVKLPLLSGQEGREQTQNIAYKMLHGGTVMAQDPIDLEFRPFQSPYLENPFPFFAHYRREMPVFFSPTVGMWVVTRYADVQTVVKDPQLFSSKKAFTFPASLTPEGSQLLQVTMFGSHSSAPAMTDPPYHTHLSRPLASAFSARQVMRLEPDVRELATHLIDDF